MALTPAQFASTTFDYLIAGGGTAGLTLAARLSENPKIQVGVIEAGKDTTEDPLVLNPSFTLALWDNPDYDWSFKSAPQVRSVRGAAQSRAFPSAYMDFARPTPLVESSVFLAVKH